jgi:carbonic anhydrase
MHLRSSLRLLLSVSAMLAALALAQEKSAPTPASSLAKPAPTSLTAAQALAKLKEGNARFVAHQLKHPDETIRRREELRESQHPFAIVLGCADSRAAPELIFDQGLGDLFTVRVAGNVSNPEVLGSIEYAVEHLEVPLIVVLGHERCGAVTAARDASVSGAEAPGHLKSLVEDIRPAIAAAGGPSDLDAIVWANVRLVTAELLASEPFLKERVQAGKLQIIGARYDLDTGAVAFK